MPPPEVVLLLRVIRRRRGKIRVIFIVHRIRGCRHSVGAAPGALAPQRYAFGRPRPVWQATISPVREAGLSP